MPEVQKIQWRRGTAAAWTAANPVLSEGTPGFESDTGKFKIGDGTKDWKTLAYQGDVAAGVAAGAVTTTVVDADEFPVSSAGVLKKLSWANLKAAVASAFGLRPQSVATSGTVSEGFDNKFAPSPGNFSLGVGTDSGVTTGASFRNKATESQVHVYDAVDKTKKIDLNLFSANGGLVKINNVAAVDVSSTQTLTNKSLTDPKINKILDTNGAIALGITAGPSAVNYLAVNNAAAGSNPVLGVWGADASVSMHFKPKGTGGFKFLASNNNELVAITPNVTDPTGSIGRLSITNAPVSAANPSVTITSHGGGAGSVRPNSDLLLETDGAGTVQANGIPVVTTTGVASLSNKTIVSPTITAPTITGAATLNGHPIARMVPKPPITTSAGTIGDFSVDSNYLYVAYGSNAWGRIPLDTAW
jgi:hypothetical protein